MAKNELICEILRLYDRVAELESENKQLKELEGVRKAFSDVPDISWSARVVDDSLNALKAKFVDEYFSGDKFNEIYYPYYSTMTADIDFDTWLDRLGADAFDSMVFCKSMTMGDLKRIFREQLKACYRKARGEGRDEK